jgi:hypothetical protein
MQAAMRRVACDPNPFDPFLRANGTYLPPSYCQGGRGGRGEGGGRMKMGGGEGEKMRVRVEGR